MNTHADKTQTKERQSISAASSQMQSSGESTFQFTDNRPQTVAQRKLQEMANNSPQVSLLRVIQEMANNSPHAKQAAQLQAIADNSSTQYQLPIQKKENKTGLPDDLKTNIENTSRYSMDDVKVHLNSTKPAQLHAHAYTQGTDIYIAPGQKKHLPHEAWHVVQQKQGRVQPTTNVNGVAINEVSELEKEADTWHTNAIQKNSKEGAQTTELQSRILGKEDVRQLIFISFTIIHNRNRFKVEKIADLLVWLRSNPICSNKSLGSFANQETLMHLCNAISAEAGTQLSRRKLTGTQVWNTLERISKTDKKGNKNIMPQYRMLDPVKIKTHINLLKFEYRNINKEKARDNEYIKRFYIEAGSNLDKLGNICISFGALMSFFRKQHKIKYNGAKSSILKTEIIYLKHFQLDKNFDLTDFNMDENVITLAKNMEREYNEAKKEMQEFLRFRTSLQIKNGEGINLENWTTYSAGELESNEEIVPKHFKRKLSSSLLLKQMIALKEKLAGYQLVGFHGTAVENISTLVKEGIDQKRFGSGHGSGKGEGLYIIPLQGLNKTIRETLFWGHSSVAVFLPKGCKVVSARSGDRIETLEKLRIEKAESEKLIYMFGSSEAVIPPSLCRSVKLTCDPSSISMVNTSDLDDGEQEYETYTSIKEEFDYLNEFDISTAPSFNRFDLDDADDLPFVFEHL